MALYLRLLTACMLGLLSHNLSAASEDIHIQDPWVRAAPPTVKVLAGYFTMNNHGDSTLTLVAVSSPYFNKVEIHRSVMHENMAHMEQQQELIIPSHSTVTLKPGALHLMLKGANKSLQTGDSVPFTLTFHNGDEITFTAIVRMDGGEDRGHSGHMNHSEHNH